MSIRTTKLPSGDAMPVLGLGTWRMGEKASARSAEADALRLGLDLGMNLIDTAEMYGDGGAEEVTGDAIAGRRDAVFLVSKVLPHNASKAGTIAACERSLKRLRTDRLDLYLLHWRGGVDLAETVEAFGELKRSGKIRHWGVSNFDLSDMNQLAHLSGGDAVASNQILYNPRRRGPEYDVVPWCRERSVSIMAYSPVDQGALVTHPTLREIGQRHGASAAQIAIAWLLRQDGCVVIPKASRAEHVRDNRAAYDLVLDADDLAAIDAAFPPPKRKQKLEMI